MNGKERINKVLSLEAPDAIPYGEFAIDFDTVEKILGHETYLRAKAKSQIAFWEGRRDEVVQSWKEDLVALYKKLDCIDIVYICANAAGHVPPRGYSPDPPKKISPNTWEDREGRIYKLSEVTKDITLVHDPHEWTREYKIEDYLDYCFAPPDPGIFEVVDHAIGHLGCSKYLAGNSSYYEYTEMPMLGTMERTFVEYAQNPNLIKAVASYNYEKDRHDSRYYIRPGQDAVLWGQDFAYNSGPFISPEMFSEFVEPYVKKRVEEIREAHGLPVLKHACGNNWKLLDMFVGMGYQCYQSIQESAEMDLKEVKCRYGNRICLWGGVPVELLISGTPGEIRQSVRRAIDCAKENGGYIFGSSHSIAVGSRYDNYMAMLDEFEKHRYY